MVVYRPTVSHLVEAMQPRAPVCLVQYVVQGEQIKVYNLAGGSSFFAPLPPSPAAHLVGSD